MTPEEEALTLAAFNLVKALIAANGASFSTEIGPVHDTEGNVIGNYRVVVEKVEVPSSD